MTLYVFRKLASLAHLTHYYEFKTKRLVYDTDYCRWSRNRGPCFGLSVCLVISRLRPHAFPILMKFGINVLDTKVEWRMRIFQNFPPVLKCEYFLLLRSNSLTDVMKFGINEIGTKVRRVYKDILFPSGLKMTAILWFLLLLLLDRFSINSDSLNILIKPFIFKNFV